MKKIKPIIVSILIIVTMFGLFGQLNKELKFTKKYFNQLEQNVEGIELVSLKELEIKTRHNENELTHNLDNAYSEYVRETENKDEVLERYIKSALDLYRPKPDFSPDKIVPNIKDWRYLEEIRKIGNSKEIESVYEKYNEELYIFYAQDLENSISYLTKDNLVEFDIDTSGLREKAIENLLNSIPKIERHGGDGYFMMTAGGDYEASLILNQTIWTKDNFPVKGEIIIGIPSRDLLLITGSEDKENIKRLKSTIAEINQNGNHLVSDKIYIYNDEIFELFKE